MNADTKTLEQRARELLAKEYESSGIHALIIEAKYVRSGENPAVSDDAAVRAIIAALSSAAAERDAMQAERDRMEEAGRIMAQKLDALNVPTLSSAEEAKGVEYDRQAVAKMLDVLFVLPHHEFRPSAIAEQAALLRAADEADAAGVRTVCRGPALDMEVVREALADALSEAEEMAKVYEGYARGKHFTEWAGKYRAQLAIIDASAPSSEKEGRA